MLQERLSSLALISIKREFLSADVINEVVRRFSDRRAHMGKEIVKCKCLIQGLANFFVAGPH